MAFDFYTDFRTLSTVPIRSDSWMGAETSGCTFTGEVLVESGVTLTLWQGTEIEFVGGLMLEPGSRLVVEDGVVVTLPNQDLLGGSTVAIEMYGTAQIVADDPDFSIVSSSFTAVGDQSTPLLLAPNGAGQPWKGLYLVGGLIPTEFGSEWPHYLEHVRIEGAEVGLDLRTAGAELTHVEFVGNGVGIATDYFVHCSSVGCSLPAPTEASFHQVLVEGSSDRGLYLRNAEVALWESTVRDTGGDGVYVQNAILTRFSENVIEGNGAFDPLQQPSYGLRVSTGGDVDASRRGDTIGWPGLNRLHRNEREISYAAGSYLFLGEDLDPYDDPIGHHNTIDAGTSGCWVVNNSGTTLLAEMNYWGSTSGPPSGVLCGSSAVSYEPFHDADETGDSGGGYRPVVPGLLLAAASGATPIASRDVTPLTQVLRGEMRRLRGLVAEHPASANAANRVQRLAGLHRRDVGDRTGEWAASRQLLAQLSGHLTSHDGPVAPAHRRTAERAVVVLLQVALATQDFEAADALLGAHEELVTGVAESRILALTAINVEEAFGRYDEALARIDVLLAELGSEEAGLVAELEYLAGVIAAKRDEADAEGRGTPVLPAVAATAASSTPDVFALEPAYPNPTSGAATLPLLLPDAAEVSVAAYDLLGRRVAVVAERRFEAGRHEVVLDGRGLAAGVYVVRAELIADDARRHLFSQRVTVVP